MSQAISRLSRVIGKAETFDDLPTATGKEVWGETPAKQIRIVILKFSFKIKRNWGGWNRKILIKRLFMTFSFTDLIKLRKTNAGGWLVYNTKASAKLPSREAS